MYFAGLAETLGIDNESLQLSDQDKTVGDLKNLLSTRGEQWRHALADKSTRCALNQSVVDDTAPLSNGAEVAFFPPVTGG